MPSSGGLLQNDWCLQALDKRIDAVDQRLGRLETGSIRWKPSWQPLSERLVKVQTWLGGGHVVLTRSFAGTLGELGPAFDISPIALHLYRAISFPRLH